MSDNEPVKNPETGDEAHKGKTLTEEIEVAGNQVVERVKDLVAEGNVRRLVIKGADNDVIIEMPLTVGAVAGGAIVLAAPWLAALGAFAALVAKVKIEIVREAGPTDKPKNE